MYASGPTTGDFYRHLAGLSLAGCLQTSLLFTWPIIGLESGQDGVNQLSASLGASLLVASPLLLCLPGWLTAGRIGPRCSLWLGGLFAAICIAGPLVVGGDGAWLCALALCAGCLGLSLSRYAGSAPTIFLLLPITQAGSSSASVRQSRHQQLLLLAVCSSGAGASLGAIVAPPAFRLLCDWLSWRGACLALAGWLLNWLVAGALMSPPRPVKFSTPGAVSIDGSYIYSWHYYYSCEGRDCLMSTSDGLRCHGNAHAAGGDANGAKRKQQSCDSGLGDSMNLSNARQGVPPPLSLATIATVADVVESTSPRHRLEESDEEESAEMKQASPESPGSVDAGQAAENDDDDLLFSSNRNLVRLSADRRLGGSDDVFLDVGEVEDAEEDADEVAVLPDETEQNEPQSLLPPGTPPPVSLIGSPAVASGSGVVVRFELIKDKAETDGGNDKESSFFAYFPTNFGQDSELSNASADSYRIFLQREPANLPTIPENSELDMDLVYSEHTANVDGGQGISELMDRPLDDQMYGGHLDLSQSECLEDSSPSLLTPTNGINNNNINVNINALTNNMNNGELTAQHKSRSRSLARSSCNEDDATGCSVGSLSIGSLHRQASGSSVDQLATKHRARSMDSLRCLSSTANNSAAAAANDPIKLSRSDLAELVLTKSDPELFLAHVHDRDVVARAASDSDDSDAGEAANEQVPLVALQQQSGYITNSNNKPSNNINNRSNSDLPTESHCAISKPVCKNCEYYSRKSVADNCSPLVYLFSRPAYWLACLSYALQFTSAINCLVYLPPLLALQRALPRYDCALAALGLGWLPGATIVTACLVLAVGRGDVGQRRPKSTETIVDAATSMVGVVGAVALAASAGWLSRTGLNDSEGGGGGLGAAFHGAAFACSGIGFCLAIFSSACPAHLIRCCCYGWNCCRRWQRRRDVEGDSLSDVWSVAFASVFCCWSLAGLASVLLGIGSAIWLHWTDGSPKDQSGRLACVFWINCLIACVALGLALVSALLTNWRGMVGLLRAQCTLPPPQPRRASTASATSASRIVFAEKLACNHRSTSIDEQGYEDLEITAL